MRLVDLEKRIKETLETKDIRDQDVYLSIYDLCLGFMLRNNKMSNYVEAEEVATIMAEELYMKILKGGSIVSWLGYISKSYQAYVRMWKGMNRSEIIDTKDNLDIREAILSMSLSINNNLEYQKISDKNYLENIPNVVDEVLNKSKFVPNTKEYMNAKLSILLSLISGKYISYNQDDSNSMYTRMVLQSIKSEVGKSLRINKDNTITNGMTILQLFTLENAANIGE